MQIQSQRDLGISSVIGWEMLSRRMLAVLLFTVSLACAQDFDCVDGYLEADVHPAAPSGLGDGDADFSDWLQIVLYTLNFQTPFLPCEFAAADCAPRNSGGNGVISASDCVQARRYSLGQDLPLPNRSGPTNRATWTAPLSSTRIVRLTATNLVRGEECTIAVSLAASGNESAVSLAIRLPPGSFSVRSISSLFPFNTLSDPSTVVLNTNRLPEGLIGLLAITSTNWVGATELLRITAQVSPTTPGDAAPRFAHDFVTADVSNSDAESLPTTFDDNGLFVAGRPALRGDWRPNGFRLEVIGSTGSIYAIESSTNFVDWSGGFFVTNNNPSSFLLSSTNFPAAFFRARVVE
jgi:hypothetical protein